MNASVEISWSPASCQRTYLAAATLSQLLDDTFSTNSQLELFSMNPNLSGTSVAEGAPPHLDISSATREGRTLATRSSGSLRKSSCLRPLTYSQIPLQPFNPLNFTSQANFPAWNDSPTLGHKSSLREFVQPITFQPRQSPLQKRIPCP